MTIPDDALRAHLIEQARAIAAERGWAWLEPVDVAPEADGGEAVWVVRSNALARGMNVRVAFRRTDNTVLTARYLPR